MVRTRVALTVLAVLLSVGACSSGTTQVAIPAGMVMTRGADAPSAPAAMVCSEEVRGFLRTILDTKAIPAGTPRWHSPVFDCAYALRVGPLRLSVHEATDDAATTATVRRLRAELGGGPSVIGLGADGYAPADGIVLLRKDNDVLVVDASGLPPVFGSNEQHRADLAFELATDILGCWTGDDDD
jgi:hypothetical protein